MKKRYKYLIIFSAIIVILFSTYLIASYVIAQSFQKDMQLLDSATVEIDVRHLDSNTRFSITDSEDKQELLDLLKSSISLLRLKTTDYPLDSEHNTYNIIIFDKGFRYLYISNIEPSFCIFMGNKFDYYITVGDVIADYLDEYKDKISGIDLE